MSTVRKGDTFTTNSGEWVVSSVRAGIVYARLTRAPNMRPYLFDALTMEVVG